MTERREKVFLTKDYGSKMAAPLHPSISLSLPQSIKSCKSCRPTPRSSASRIWTIHPTTLSGGYASRPLILRKSLTKISPFWPVRTIMISRRSIFLPGRRSRRGLVSYMPCPMDHRGSYVTSLVTQRRCCQNSTRSMTLRRQSENHEHRWPLWDALLKPSSAGR